MYDREITIGKLFSAHIPNLMHGIGRGMASPSIPVAVRHYGGSDGVIGIAIAAFGLGKMLLDVPAGGVVARYGVQTTMVAGLVLFMSATVMAFASATVSELVIAGFMWGVGTALVFVSLHTFLTATMVKSKRGRLMSLIGGGFRLGNVVGPLLAGFIMSFGTIRWAFGAMLPFACIAIASVSYAPDMKDVGKTMKGDHGHSGFVAAARKGWRELVAVGVFSFLIIMLRSARRVLLPIAGLDSGMTAGEVGFMMGMGQSVDTLLFPLGGYMMDHYGRKSCAVPNASLLGLAAFVLSYSVSKPFVWISAFTFGFADSFGSGMILAMGADVAPKENQAAFLGIMALLMDAAQVVSPLLIGYLTELASLRVAAGVIGAMSMLNVLWVIFVVKESHKARNRSKEIPADIVTVAPESPAPEWPRQSDYGVEDKSLHDDTELPVIEVDKTVTHAVAVEEEA